MISYKFLLLQHSATIKDRKIFQIINKVTVFVQEKWKII